MDDDAKNYLRFLDGDAHAFDEIVESLFFKLIFFVNGYVHDCHAAEDIAVDAISDLFANAKRYNFKVSLKTYLFMIGKSKALNYLKHRKLAETAVSLTETNGAGEEEARLEEIVLAEEQKRVVHAALKQLPEDRRMAVHLVYFEEMSYEEAAAVMKKSKKQLYNLIFRAKNELRTTLEKEGVDLL